MDWPIDPQEQVVQTANQNTQRRVFNQSGLFVIGLFTIVVLFIIGIGLYFFKTRSQSLTPGQSKRIGETAVSKKEWHGIIATKKGFVKINADGKIENGADNQPVFFLPLGTEAEYTKNFGNYTFGTVTFKGPQLLPDGKLVFSGSTKQQSVAKENTIYSWLIDSKETPNALVQLPEGQKIQSFAFSPDSKLVAVIAVTRRSGTELYEGIDSKALSQQEQLKIYQQRAKDLQEQLRTITIYDISTTKAVNTIKLSSSTRDGTTQLIWRKQGLFAKDFDKIILFNPDTGKIITESPDNPNQSMVVSSDGSKFFDIRMLTVHDTLKNKTTGQMNIPELIAPEEFKQGMDAEQYFIFLGPATFSPHSQNIALEAGSVSLNNFRIWEQNFENGKTRKLVDLNTLGLDSTLGTKLRHYVPFMTYNPTGTKLVFALYADNPDTHAAGRLIDIVSLDLTTLKEFRNDFLVEMNNLRELSFLGWYQAASTQSSTRPQTPGPPEASSTANWKTYTDPTNTFTIKYPPEFFEGQYTGGRLPGWKDGGTLRNYDPKQSVPIDGLSIEFSIRPKSKRESLQQAAERSLNEIGGGYGPGKIGTPDKTLVVDGKNAIWYEGGLGPAIDHIEVFIEHTDTSFVAVSFWEDSAETRLKVSEKSNTLLEAILSTFKFLDSDGSSGSLDSYLSYSIPPGWKKEIDNADFYVSPDIAYHQTGAIKSGARIGIFRQRRNVNQSLEEQVRELTRPNIPEKATSIKAVRIAGHGGFHSFGCYDQCADYYLVEKENTIWGFTFECSYNDLCSTEAELNAGKYAKDRDLFINSIKFK